MIGTSKIHAGTDFEEMKIVVNSLCLSLASLLQQIEMVSGKEAAAKAREELISRLTHGDIDMAIMEDRKTFDFVLSLVKALPIPK